MSLRFFQNTELANFCLLLHIPTCNYKSGLEVKKCEKMNLVHALYRMCLNYCESDAVPVYFDNGPSQILISPFETIL